MCTTRLQTVHASVATTKFRFGVGPQVTKFKRVSSVDHQMSVARGVWSQVWCPGGTLRYCPCGHTDACESITLPQLCLRAVTCSNSLCEVFAKLLLLGTMVTKQFLRADIQQILLVSAENRSLGIIATSSLWNLPHEKSFLSWHVFHRQLLSENKFSIHLFSHNKLLSVDKWRLLKLAEKIYSSVWTLNRSSISTE